MANADAPTGLKPVGTINGAPWNSKVVTCYVSATDSTAMFKYDPVKAMANADALGKYQFVSQASAGGQIYGVAVGFSNTPDGSFDATSLERKYRPASTAMYVKVVTDPNVVYEVQEDSDTSNIAATDMGGNFDIIVGSGSTVTGLSAVEIDSSSATNTTAQLRLLALAPRDKGNDIGTNAKWLVRVNEHFNNSTTGV